jgi:hypothetical protein
VAVKGGLAAATLGATVLALAATVTPMLLTGALAARCPQAEPMAMDGYINPFSVGQWLPARTDQGVDWVPIVPSPVVAIGDGVVTYSAIADTGWPGGAFLGYRLSGGAAAGHTVYVAEHLTGLAPVGTVVQAGQVLATALPGYPWTEWGWAAPSGPEPAVPYAGASDGSPTPGGLAFARFLETLGVRPLNDPGPGPVLPDGGGPAPGDRAGSLAAVACPGGTDTGPLSDGTISTPTDFATAVLVRLGITPNPGNVAALVAWARVEGGWGHNNPLNSTLPEPAASDLPRNRAHVKVYASMDVGVNATVSVLAEQGYAAVVAALAGSDPSAIARAVAGSPWGTPDFSAAIALPPVLQPAG